MADANFQPGEQWDARDVICPYCGYRHHDTCDIFESSDEAGREMECGECERPFQAQQVVLYRFVTRPMETTQ
jgi:hypothetical protein